MMDGTWIVDYPIKGFVPAVKYIPKKRLWRQLAETMPTLIDFIATDPDEQMVAVRHSCTW